MTAAMGHLLAVFGTPQRVRDAQLGLSAAAGNAAATAQRTREVLAAGTYVSDRGNRGEQAQLLAAVKDREAQTFAALAALLAAALTDTGGGFGCEATRPVDVRVASLADSPEPAVPGLFVADFYPQVLAELTVGVGEAIAAGFAEHLDVAVDPAVIRQVAAGACRRHLDTLWQARDRNRRLYEAYVACFTDPMQALLDLAHAADIAVAYIDRAVIEAHLDRVLTEEQWQHVASLLDDYDEHVSSWPDVNSDFINDVLRRAGVDVETGSGSAGEDPQPAPGQATAASVA